LIHFPNEGAALCSVGPIGPAPLWLAFEQQFCVFKNLLQNNMMAARKVFFSTVQSPFLT
jgi:hypothetical protein